MGTAVLTFDQDGEKHRFEFEYTSESGGFVTVPYGYNIADGLEITLPDGQEGDPVMFTALADDYGWAITLAPIIPEDTPPPPSPTSHNPGQS